MIYQTYKLYQYTSTLVSKRYSYSLYFNSKMTRIDFTTLQRRLKSVLNTYLGLSYEFEIIIVGQEEFYTVFDKESFQMSTTRSKVWKINYYIKSTTNMWVYPKFIKRIITTEIMEQMKFELISKKESSFFLESTASLISYNYHFSLDFKEPVYVTDWLQIEIALQAAWKTQTGITVAISIQDLEQLVDLEGNIFYSLIYYIKLDQSWIYALNWQSLNLSYLKLDFLNIHGYKYQFFRKSEEWKLSYSFHIGSDIRVVGKGDMTAIIALLKQTWCYSLNTFINSCDKFEIFPFNQVSETSSSGITGWDFRYFVKYNGFVIDVSTFPTFNIEQFLMYYESFILTYKYKFFLNLDYLYRYYQFRLYLKTKVDKKDYSKMKDAILVSWKKENHEFSSTTGLKVVIDSQKEKVDIHGESKWEIGYHIEANGNRLRPESTNPTNKTGLQIEIDNRVTAGKYEISTSTSSTTTLISTDYFAGLLLSTKIDKDDKFKFQSALEMYYRNVSNVGAETNVVVTVGPVKQVITSEGKLAWELSYHVTVNGTSVSVDTLNQEIDYTHLQGYLQIKTKYGKEVTLVTSASRKKIDNLFSISISHKVSKSDLTKVVTGLKKTFQALNTEYINCSCVDIKVWNQHEQLSETGEVSWNLQYGITVNGRPIDASLATWPTWQQLLNYLKIQTDSGFKIHVLDSTDIRYTSTSLLHSLYFSSYVAKSSYSQITTSLKTTWTAILDTLGIKGDLHFNFRRHSEWSSTLGHSVWKLDYDLMLNSTRLDKAALEVDLAHFKHLQQLIANLQSPSGALYQLLESSSLTLREYLMHFPLYFTTKVAYTNQQAIKDFILHTWSSHYNDTYLNKTTIEIHEQKEMIDMQGTSFYKLVYYLMHNGEIVDSRMMTYHMITKYLAEFLMVTNPRGHRYQIISEASTLIREDLLFNTILHRPLTVSTKLEFLHFLKSVLMTKMPGENISVGIIQQKEFLTESSMSVWKAKFYFQLNGEYMMPIAISGLSTQELYTAFLQHNMTANFNIVEITQQTQLYSYEDRYVLFFNKNISFVYWPYLEGILLETWLNNTEYSNCGCLQVTIKGIQEVVDIMGVTRFKLVYFLSKNETIVSSQTSVDINFHHLEENLIDVVNIEGNSFELVKLIEHEATRVDSMFTIYLNRGIRLDHKQQAEYTIMEFLNASNTDCCSKVEILRQMEYLTVQGHQLWQIDFIVKHHNETLDIKRLEQLNVTLSLQEAINESNGTSIYEIITHTDAILDYRKSYSLYLTTTVRKSDLSKFEMAVYNYIRQTVGIAINVSVIVPQVTEIIDVLGVTYQKVSVFIYFNGNPVIPGSGAMIDTILIQQEIDKLNVKGAKGEYKLVNRKTSVEDRHYSYSLDFYVNKPVRHTDLLQFQLAFESVWRMELHEWQFDHQISVKISSQEEYTDKNGLSVFKLVYYLQKYQQNTYKQEVPSNQLPELSEARMNEVILFLTSNQQYKMISKQDIVRYSSMFTFYMMSPILLPDIGQIEERLSVRWNSYLNTTSSVMILFQEEVANTSSYSQIWRVSYLVMGKNLLQINSNYQEELNEVDYIQALDVNFTSVGDTYNNLIVSRPSISSSIIRYKETFSVYFTQRVLQTQYSEFETALAISWNMSKIEAVTVTIAGQQEVITQAGKSAFKLVYVVTTQTQQITSLYTEGLNYQVLSQNLNIMTSIGTKYAVMDVKSSFKLEEAFQVYVSKAVFRVDRDGFKIAVKQELKNIMPNEDFNHTEVEWRSQTGFLNIKNPAEKIWRQLFIVRRNDGVVISAEKQRKLTKVAVDFTSLAGQNYTVLSTSLKQGYIQETNLFSLSVVGRIGTVLSTLQTIIQSSWTAFDSIWTIVLRETEEFIGDDGTVITRIPYIVKKDTEIAYPDVTRAPVATAIATSLSMQLKKEYSVYSGKKLVEYNSCFSLSIKREASLDIKTSEIEYLLQRIWTIITMVTESVKVSVESIESFVGDFGIKINQILYTVTLNEVKTEPTFDVKPDDAAIQLLLEQETGYKWSIYRGLETYRLSVVYSIDLTYSETLAFTSETRKTVESSLHDIWAARTDNACSNCSVSIVNRKEKLGFTTAPTGGYVESRISQIYYTVQSEGRHLKSYVESAPNTTVVNTALTQSGLSVWNQETFVTRSVYLEGYSRQENRQTFVMGLTEAWSQVTGINVEVTLTKVERFVDESWNQLTKVEYVVKANDTNQLSNGTDVVSQGPSPNTTDVTQAFKKIGKEKKVCSCKPLKHHKVFVKGTPQAVDHQTVGLALNAAWLNKNNKSPSLKKLLNIKTKNNKVRTRRATDNNSTETKYIGKDGEEIVPIDYTMGLDGQEPDPIFLNTPSPTDFDAAGLQGCNCTPRKAGTLKLAGNVKESSKGAVKKAVYEAVVKANPDILPADLSVEILSLSGDIKDANGNEVSDVTYAITRSDDGDIEDVIYPNAAQLDEALKNNGLALYDKDKRPSSPEDEDWKIILAAVLGSVAALIIIGVIVYILVQRKKRKNMNLKKQKENVYNEIYDKENFSSAIAYSNQVYETQEASINFPE